MSEAPPPPPDGHVSADYQASFGHPVPPGYPAPPGHPMPPGGAAPYAHPPYPMYAPQRWVLPKETYTPWSSRVWAFLIDWIPLFVIVVVPWLGWVITEAADKYCIPSRTRCPSHTSQIWGLMLFLGLLCGAVFFFWNLCHRQGKTGQSIGKSMLKFKCISDKTWAPIGFWPSLGRQAAHHLDQTICYVGYLFPIWDDKRQTLADKIVSTVCVPVNWTAPPAPPSYAYGAQPITTFDVSGGPPGQGTSHTVNTDPSS